MANYFVDEDLSTGGDTGSTTDDAWRSLVTALAYTGFTAGDKIWVRRRSKDVYSEHLELLADGNRNEPMWCIGWPRNSLGFTGDLTQGERCITDISITPNFESHCARYASINNQGEEYTISAILHKIHYIDQAGDSFIEGDSILSTSTATGKAHKINKTGDSGDLWIVEVGDSIFSDGDTIDSGGGTATISGAPSDDGFFIMNRLAGSSVTGDSFTINTDIDYTEAQTIDDTAWTIKLSEWNADEDSLATMDFGGGAYYLYLNGDYWWAFRNFHMKSGSNAAGTLYFRVGYQTLIENWIFSDPGNAEIIKFNDGTQYTVIKCCVLKGTGTGTLQRGIELQTNYGSYLKDVSIYNMGDRAIINGAFMHLENVNLGIATSNVDVVFDFNGLISGRDLECEEGVSSLTGSSSSGAYNQLFIENWGHEKGVSLILKPGVLGLSVNVIEGSGDPYKRSEGENTILSIIEHNNVSIGVLNSNMAGLENAMFKHSFYADTTSKNYRYYLQADSMAITTVDEVFIEVEYCDDYNSSSVYHYTKVRSNETITARTGADDWSQYIEVTNIQPAVAGIISIRFYCSFYDIDGILYIDPLPEIT